MSIRMDQQLIMVKDRNSYGGIGVFFNDNNPMNISEAMIINGDGNVTKICIRSM